MNILVFSNNAWDDTNSLGNTLSNFFKGFSWNKDNFYNIYLRNAIPNNNVCKDYYQMTALEMLKNNYKKENIGYRFNNLFLQSNDIVRLNKEKKEKRFINFLHKYSIKFVYNIVNYVYRKKKWINNNFKNYIKDVNPDIVFSFLIDVSILKPFVEYIKNNTSSKIVLFISDDIYNTYKSNKLKKEFKKIIEMSDKLYGASRELCEVYGKMFNKRIDVLYKGCSFDYPIKNNINNPIKFVYAGNLFYGRVDILAKIARAIEKNNKKNKQKGLLEIYTGATITSEIKEKLNINNCSIIMGRKDYNEIKKIMNNSDYNLQVESFEKHQIDCVKYSFSTKIIDCLQSGSSILAIGPKNLSSIEYIRDIPGAYVIDNIDNIEYKIEKLINNNKKIILENTKKIRQFALENHNIQHNQKKLRDDFIKLING